MSTFCFSVVDDRPRLEPLHLLHDLGLRWSSGRFVPSLCVTPLCPMPLPGGR